MTDARMQFIAAGGALLLVLGGLACSVAPPPVQQGFISIEPGARGRTDVTAVGGPVGLFSADGASIVGNGGLNAEPFVGQRLSVPVGVGVGGSPAWVGSRVGLRYRPREYPITVGVGGGPGLTVRRYSELELAAREFDVGSYGALDLEFAMSHRWRRFALSGALRPALSIWNLAQLVSFYGLIEITPAVFFTESIAMTLHVVTGPQLSVAREEGGTYSDPLPTGVLGGGLGLYVQFDGPKGRGRE